MCLACRLLLLSAVSGWGRKLMAAENTEEAESAQHGGWGGYGGYGGGWGGHQHGSGHWDYGEWSSLRHSYGDMVRAVCVRIGSDPSLYIFCMC
jgi:hypothetical protein